MIKFFRKIRQNLLSEGKTGKYLKYAIGEIILVVIGILIALQINNWNEKRQNKLKVDNLLQKIQQDIETDISEIVRLTKFYAKKDSLIQLVLDNKLTKEDYQKPTSINLHYLIYNRDEINLKNIGYSNLMRVQDIIPQEYNSILEQLSTQYNDDFVYVDEAEERFNYSDHKFSDFLFEKYDWYSSQVPEFMNEERIDYFVNNVRHKGMVKKYQSYGIHNYLNSCINYAYEAIKTHKQINNVLNTKNPKPLFDFEIDSTLKGTYSAIPGYDFQLTQNEERVLIVAATDTVSLFQYDTNKFFMQQTFVRFEKVNDSINMYVNTYENGSKPIATKID